MRIKTAAVCTLGCKVNQYDTDALLAALSARGVVIKDFDASVDLYIINTCTVTHTGDRKSRQMIRRARRLNPEALVAACGCLTALSADTARDCGADLVFDARTPESLFIQLTQLQLAQWDDETDTAADVNGDANTDAVARRTRCFIKIQEGCENFCTYCIVPYARGPIVSRPVADICAEAAACVAGGAREIVLTGIQVAAYGKDENNITLPDLIKLVAGSANPHPPERLRLGSLDPRVVDDAFLATVRALPTLCSHFHLSLQSGCDVTLQRMNRWYTTADYAAVVGQLRVIRPDAAFTTDIIVGFPGETDADFEESLRFVEAMGFARVHVFVYSARAGTPAAAFPAQIAADVKAERSRQMRLLADSAARRFMSGYIGRTRSVLFETGRDGVWEGHTDNYLTVQVGSGKNLLNTIMDVRLTALTPEGTLSGVPVSDTGHMK